MKIIKLTVQNVMRIKAVEITPEGNVITISGKNGAGKSACLHSIAMGIGGKKFIPAEPIRRGERSGEIVIDLGDLVVTRRFGKKPELEVRNREGAVQGSPQTILNKLKGSVGFDAGEFSRMKGDKQEGTLKALVGLDFTTLDNRRQAAYDNRTQVNRDLKTANAKLDDMPSPHVEVTDEEVSVTDLARELEGRQLQVVENSDLRRALQNKHDTARVYHQNIADKEKEIGQIEKQRDDMKQGLKFCNAKITELAAEESKLKDPDVEEIRTKIAGAEAANRKVRENNAREILVEDVDTLTAKAGSYTATIDAVDAEKKALIADAKMPIDGLGFGDAGVELNGFPLDQAASSEQLRVSVAIGMALNPDFGFVMIEDGSLLDEDSRRMVAEMAKEADGEVWMEVVDSDDPTAVIIEDGMVRETEATDG